MWRGGSKPCQAWARSRHLRSRHLHLTWRPSGAGATLPRGSGSCQSSTRQAAKPDWARRRRWGSVANVIARGEQLGSGLKALAQRFDFMADVRGRGLLWGLELGVGSDHHDAPALSRGVAAWFGDLCFAEGLIVYPSGVAPLNNAVLPSSLLAITAGEVTELLVRLERGLEQITPDLESAT